MDQKLKKWIRWLKEIENELSGLVKARHIFWSVQELIRKNKNIQNPGDFNLYLWRTYISDVAMAIRRQIKSDKQSISFSALLSDIAENYKKVSRKYYRGLYASSNVPFLADDDFDQLCNEPGDAFISQEMVKRDLFDLKERAHLIEKYADRKIAHLDRSKPKVIPKFQDVDDAINALDGVYVKYYRIFHGNYMETLKPTFQHDWQAIFDYPWRIKTNKKLKAESL